MTKQVKLSKSEIKACIIVRDNLYYIGSWRNTPEGNDYWMQVYGKIISMATHGTSDGKPWVEPPSEPEVVIDDQWAAVWPRRLVMVRDRERDPWEGPYRLGMANDHNVRYVVFLPNDERGFFSYCRPCTPDEISAYEAANGKQEQPAERFIFLL